MNELNETVEVVDGFNKAVDVMKKLQRAYTTARLDTELSGQAIDAIRTLRDMVEELVVVAYGPVPSPFKSGVVDRYVVDPKVIPPGFALVDEAQLKAELIAPAFDNHTKQVIELRIRDMFKRIAR